MVESLVSSDPPDYDKLERISIDYFESMRTASRPFSILLFIMPVVLIFTWIVFPDTLWLLILSIMIYLVVIFLSIYSRFRVEKRYRALDCSLAYYITHSDSSVYTIRMASVVMAVLIFVLVETYQAFSQYEFFIVVNLFIAASLVLSIFSPRFWHYHRSSKPEISPEVQAKVEQIKNEVNMPNFALYVIPEKKMKVANAYCTGMLRNRVYITDYLVDNLTDAETTSILAHELGHAFHRHNLKTLVMTFFFLFASASLFFSSLYVPSLIISSILEEGGILLFILGIPVIIPMIRRGYEYQADMFSSRFTDEETAVNALLKTNYLNMTPLNLSGGATHPPLVARISRIRGTFGKGKLWMKA